MPRRSSRPAPIADDAELPDGFIRHDGGACPIHADSRPALLLRSGTRTRSGSRTASSWGPMWEHGTLKSSMDIVGYRLDD